MFNFNYSKMKTTKLSNGGRLNEYSDGAKAYYLNDKLHREDGPAVEYNNGDKWWFLNGKRHREDGPAIEYTNGGHTKYWYINGKLIPCTTQKEFERLMRLKAFW
jgi:antitoxin component YwqK of YwqJK toxin-antitoxin module